MRELTRFTSQSAFIQSAVGQPSKSVRSLFYSADPKALSLWEKNMPSGKLLTVLDSSIHCNVVELSAAEKAKDNYISTPVYPVKNLHVRQPIFVMVVKNIHEWFSFEMTMVDSTGRTIHLHGSTLQKELDIQGDNCSLPLHFTDGWNQVQIDLNDFTIRCFGTSYWETMSVKVSSNCHLHRLYFCESTNHNHPHKFTSSSTMLLNPDDSPGGDGDGFDIGVQQL